MTSHPLTGEALTRAKAYQRERTLFFFAHQAASAVFLATLLFSGASVGARDVAARIFQHPSLQVLVYLCFFFLFSTVFEGPFCYVSQHLLEKRYSLSNETLARWLWTFVKKNLLSFVFGALVLEGLYALLRRDPQGWWVSAWVCWIGVTLLLGRIVPVLIVPLFYRYSPIAQEAVRSRILNLVQGYGLPIENVYSINLSKTTKKANAAFLGIGRSKRVVLSDTLLAQFSEDEIEVIVAHEVGHYKLRHLWKQLAFSTLSSFAAFWAAHVVLQRAAWSWGLAGLADPANLPLLGLVVLAFSLVWMPAENGFSRRMEREADGFALAVTRRTKAFIQAMEKLARVNLADPEPHPAVTFFLHSHPPIAQRIAYARTRRASDPRPPNPSTGGICSFIAWTLAISVSLALGARAEAEEVARPLAAFGDATGGSGVPDLNEAGVALLNEGKFVQAISSFEQALAQDPQDPVLRQNLGAAYYRYGENLLAEDNLKLALEAFGDAVRVAPKGKDLKKNITIVLHNYGAKLYEQDKWAQAKEALLASISYGMPHSNTLEIVGDLYYQEQDLTRAREYFEKAYALTPTAALKTKLENLAREAPVENKLKSYPSEHFIIRYNKEGAGAGTEGGYKIRELLRSAHREVVGDFPDRPERKIPVILYTEDEYRQVRDAPHWSAGLFDGKIRLPAFGKRYNEVELKRTIYHELTHAFIFERVGDKVPLWLNEGLAVYEENKVRKNELSTFERAYRAGALLSLSDGSFFHFNLPQASALDALLYYQQAYLFVKYIVERYRFHAVKKLLDAYAQEQDADKAIQHALQISVETLEKRWLDWLRSQFPGA